jgi:hypothetical protein
VAEEQSFVTGSDDLAVRIANSLGLEGISVNSLSIHISAEEVICAECRFFPTRQQLEQAAKEIATLQGSGVIMGDVELFYSSILEENDEE